MHSKKLISSLVIAGLLMVMTAAVTELAVAPISPEERQDYAQSLVAYYDVMSAPKPFRLLKDDALTQHQMTLRQRILKDIGLSPLPERIDLDIHRSEAVDHPWCTVEKIQYQLWPGIYAEALLYMPKIFQENPAPAMLAPHGHWQHGFAHPDVQARCLTMAKLGYVVLCPAQQHVEDLAYGLSHQTLMVWTNMRGLDVLQSMSEVDPERIGASGASGGGLQTQMIAALDERVKAASIVGFTCDFREIMFPHAAHCWCNHFPNVMRYTDHPEIAALIFPRPVQFLTMNDWTGHFMADNLPAITTLYRENGHGDKVACTYWPTPHTYDRAKRERTYWWMEQWLRHAGEVQTAIPAEPAEVNPIAPETLTALMVENEEQKGIAQLSVIFRSNHAPEMNPLQRTNLLFTLLGLNFALPPATTSKILNSTLVDETRIEQIDIASEASLRLPALCIYPEQNDGPWPLVIVLSQEGIQSDIHKLQPLVHLPKESFVLAKVEVRFSGTYHLPDLAGSVHPDGSTFDMASPRGLDSKPAAQQKNLLQAWERNSICWGYPLVGMTVTDLIHTLNYLTAQPEVDQSNITIITRDLGHLALAAAFAAVVDERIRTLDLDFRGSSITANQPFNKAPTQIPMIPFLAYYGDMEDWLALLADRDITVHNLP